MPSQCAMRVINSAAPLRICDNGGWTDTWFAQHGKVFNIAVQPGVEVQVTLYPPGTVQDRILLHVEDYGQRYAVHLGERSALPSSWGPHPLLEAAIVRAGVPESCAVEVSVHSAMPPGASTGTSAAVSLALLGALYHLNGRQFTPHEIAYEAHAVEVEMLGKQSGIQDQLCAAYGGINFIEISNYPDATVLPIRVPDAVWWELERRLVLIYLGKAHDSSKVHEKVITELEEEGPESKRLQALRATAEKSRNAIMVGDFTALGRAMIENTEAQGQLHPDLISRDAQQVIGIAKECGAIGWKVNGAGGEGGSVTILCPEEFYVKRHMVREVEVANSLFRSVPIYLSRYGLCIWESRSQ